MHISRRFRTIPGGIPRHVEPTSRADSISIVNRVSQEDEQMRFTKSDWKMKSLWLLLLLLLLLPSRLAWAQADILGEWSPRVYNDGVDVGDYTGIPINEAGRLRAESWHEPEQVIYTADRPHPSPNAAHKWSGFSTAHWEGNTLVYTTDHLKEAYLTRTGVPRSAKATVTTRIHRYGNYLNVTFIINDPAYLTEPYIREYSWVYTPDQVIAPFPCEIIPEETIIAAGTVPSYLPGKNDILTDFATEYGIPLEAALGGAETIYPEYIKKMKTMKIAPRTTSENYKRTQ